MELKEYLRIAYAYYVWISKKTTPADGEAINLNYWFLQAIELIANLAEVDDEDYKIMS